MVKIKPLAPTKDPATIKTLFSSNKPANAAAIPEKEFKSDITTGISPPPIGNTNPTPPNKVKTSKSVKKSKVGVNISVSAAVKKINQRNIKNRSK